jgi:hypothetical protein
VTNNSQRKSVCHKTLTHLPFQLLNFDIRVFNFFYNSRLAYDCVGPSLITRRAVILMLKNMNWNKGNKGNKMHLFRKLGIYGKIGKKILAFQSQWGNSYRFTFYFKAGSLHLKRQFAKVPGSANNIRKNCCSKHSAIHVHYMNKF